MTAPRWLLSVVVATGLLAVTAGFVSRAMSTGQTGAPPTADPAATAAKSDDAARPRAVLVDPAFDLGVLVPGDTRTHRFEIRNEGSAELVLTLGSTTCKCTLADFKELRIAPGASDFVQLEWRAENLQYRFRQGAIINTNDPDLRQFELMGEGTVRQKFASIPESAYAADVPRHTKRTLSVLIYSQAFSELEVLAIKSSRPDVEAAVSPTPPTTVPPEEARYYRDLVVTLGPQKPGSYSAVLTIEYRGRTPDGKEEVGAFELPVAYDVTGDLSVFGRDMVGNVLVIGAVSQQTGARKQIYLHVRGETAEGLELNVKTVTPDDLRVEVGEAQKLSPTMTRFPIAVVVPAGLKLQGYTESDPAEIVLSTNHPDYPVVRFKASLLVVP